MADVVIRAFDFIGQLDNKYPDYFKNVSDDLTFADLKKWALNEKIVKFIDQTDFDNADDIRSDEM